MSPHYFHHMSQGSQVSQSAVWQCFSTMARFLAVICHKVPGSYLSVPGGYLSVPGGYLSVTGEPIELSWDS